MPTTLHNELNMSHFVEGVDANLLWPECAAKMHLLEDEHTLSKYRASSKTILGLQLLMDPAK